MIHPSLDATDIAILTELQCNGRIKNIDLANKISLSPSPCLKRVKRLQDIGLIKGYGAIISINQLSSTIQILTQFSMNTDTVEKQQRFEKMIVDYPEVMECFMGSGGFDYMVKFICRNIDHYQQVIQSILDSNMDVAKYTSYVIMKEVVNRTAYPIKTLLQQ